jgi:hypothetical protein
VKKTLEGGRYIVKLGGVTFTERERVWLSKFGFPNLVIRAMVSGSLPPMNYEVKLNDAMINSATSIYGTEKAALDYIEELKTQIEAIKARMGTAQDTFSGDETIGE